MIANHKGEIPVVILILPFLLGIGLGFNLFAGVNVIGLTILFFTVCFIFLALNLTYNRLKLYKLRWVGGIFINLILFLCGWLMVINHNELNNKNHFSKIKSQYLVVKISNEPVLKNGYLRFIANAETGIYNNQKTNVSGNLLIAIKDSSAKNLFYGDELLIPAKETLVDPPFNPAEFNYKQYLANQNIHYQLFIYPKQYIVVDKGQGNPVIAWSLRLRQHLVEKLKLNMHDTAAIAVASTLILGYKANLSDDIREAYSKTGTIHVLSVSGAHAAILYFLLAWALSFLDRFSSGKLIRAFIIITIVWYYALLSGFSPAVCRASVMISMVIIGKTYSRYINTLNILAISAFALLFYNPYFIADVGFQLSYIAISGLVIFQPIVYKWFSFKHKWADKLWALCSLSIAAQIITFPLNAFYFHQFPVYFLVSNLFIIIPSTVIMYSGILYLLLPQIPFVSAAIAFVLEKSILLMNTILTAIEHSPYASIGKIWPTTFEYLLLYVLIISLFYFLYDKKVWLLKLSLICTLLFCISVSYHKISLSQSQTITWLNLKKHKGIIFKNGNNAVVLTDIKPNDKIYQYSVQPYLDSCQVGNINIVDMNSNFKSAWFVKQDNLVQFLKQRIFILNQKIANNIFAPQLKTNYIYLTNNPKTALSEINNNFNYQTIIVDGSNNDHLITDISKQAAAKNVDYKILKRNISLVSVSN